MTATAPGYSDTKAEYLRRLRRIEGQVRGLHRMVEEDTYCIDVLTQVSAVNRALQGVAVGLVQDHLSHCVSDAVGRAANASPESRAEADAQVAEKIDEAGAAIARLLKS